MLNRNQSPPDYSNNKVSSTKTKIFQKSDVMKTIYVKNEKKLTIRPGTYTMEESKTNLKNKITKSSPPPRGQVSKESFTVQPKASPRVTNLKPTQRRATSAKLNSMSQTSKHQQPMNYSPDQRHQQNYAKYSMSDREKLMRNAEILHRKKIIDNKYTNLRRNREPQTASRQMHYRSVQMMQNQMAFSPQQYQQMQMYMWQQNAAAYRSPWYSEMRQVRYADQRQRINEQTAYMAKYKKEENVNVSSNNSAKEDIDSELSIDNKNTNRTSEVLSQNVRKTENQKYSVSTTEIKLKKSTSGDEFYECAETPSRLQSATSKTKHVPTRRGTPEKTVNNVRSKSKVNTFWKFEEVSLQKNNDLANQIQLLTDAVKQASEFMNNKSRTTFSDR